MALYEGPVQALIDELGRLPGVGPKSAQRIAFHLLRVDPVDARRLAAAIVDAKERVTWCRQCFNISEGELCAYCRDDRRNAPNHPRAGPVPFLQAFNRSREAPQPRAGRSPCPFL